MHRSYKFSLLTLAGRGINMDRSAFAFFLHDVRDLASKDAVFALTREEIQLLNPNTGTLPIFRARRDAEIAIESTGESPSSGVSILSRTLGASRSDRACSI